MLEVGGEGAVLGDDGPAVTEGLGFPGGANRNEVVDAMEQVYQRVRKAGRRVGSDVMGRLDVKGMLIDSARRSLNQ